MKTPKNSVDINQQLLDAVIDNDPVTTQHCLERGANPNFFEDSAKIRPLHFAAIYQSDRVVNLLILAGADLNAKCDQSSETPLDIATRKHNQSMIKQIKAAKLLQSLSSENLQ